MKLFFRRYGQGPPLILLHGLFGQSDNWQYVAKALQHCYSVILPDMRNHGHSPWSEIHNYEAMAADVIELADNEGIDTFYLAGHSMGGKTAIYCTMKVPERINGLFVGDISPFTYEQGSTEHDQQQRTLSAMVNTEPSDFASRRELETHLEEIAGEKITRLVLSKNIIFEGGKLRWRLNVDSINANMSHLLEGLPRDSGINAITDSTPVIFMKGEKSGYIDDKDIPLIHRVFPGVRIVIARDAGHWIHTEKTTDVIEALKDLKTLYSGESCD